MEKSKRKELEERQTSIFAEKDRNVQKSQDWFYIHVRPTCIPFIHEGKLLVFSTKEKAETFLSYLFPVITVEPFKGDSKRDLFLIKQTDSHMVNDFFLADDLKMEAFDYVDINGEWDREIFLTYSKETKQFNVTVTCMTVYNSSIDVPADFTYEQAIEYAREHLDEIPLGEMEYISDSDELDEENCSFDE